MPIPQKKYEQVNPLLDVLFDETKARTFPINLYSQPQDSVNFEKLFEEAETVDVGGKRLLFFVALSLALYENSGANTSWITVIHDFLKKEGLEDLYKEFYANFIKQSSLSFKEGEFNFKVRTSDLLREFGEGISKGRARWGEALYSQRDEDVDELFSRLFAPGQRDIIRKLLYHEALTKTERETFSRVVKKKLMAIIDPDLQRVARVLTGSGWKRRKKADNPQSLQLVRKDPSLEIES